MFSLSQRFLFMIPFDWQFALINHKCTRDPNPAVRMCPHTRGENTNVKALWGILAIHARPMHLHKTSTRAGASARVRQSFVKLHRTSCRVNVSVCLASKPRGTARSVPAIHQALFPLYRMTTCISLNKIYSAIDHPAWSSGPSVCSSKETISRRMMMVRRS